MSATPSEPIAFFERAAAGVTAFPVSALLFFHPLVGRAFVRMFREFGALAVLPALTKLSLSWWFPVLLGLAPLGMLLRALMGGTPASQRRYWIAGAFLLACVGLAICTAGVYLPIFDLAGPIKTDVR